MCNNFCSTGSFFLCNNFYPTQGGCATISAPGGGGFYNVNVKIVMCYYFYTTEGACAIVHCATISAPRGGGCYNFNSKIDLCYHFYTTEERCATISAPRRGVSAFSVQHLLPHKVPCQGALCNYVCAIISTLLPGRGSAFPLYNSHGLGRDVNC